MKIGSMVIEIVLKKFDVPVVATIRRSNGSVKTKRRPSQISFRIGARSSASRGFSLSRVNSSATNEIA